jgi:hypothetical protein
MSHEATEDFKAFLSQSGFEPAIHVLVRIFYAYIRLSYEVFHQRHAVISKPGSQGYVRLFQPRQPLSHIRYFRKPGCL